MFKDARMRTLDSLDLNESWAFRVLIVPSLVWGFEENLES